MFLALVLCQLALAAANPFHKYPYVFLLDIGNEELLKTNTEQIRLSIPGGSLALRYPAVGDGDTIAHIRVSGIDFGTDLKANIIDGGPGYKYVVLVFMGNPGVPYDAVMTIQTVSDKDINDSNQSGAANPITSGNDIDEANNSAEIIDDGDTTYTKNKKLSNVDANDSSEDLSDDTKTLKDTSGNGELSQESANIYSYAKNDVEGEEEDDNEDTEESAVDDSETNNVQSAVNDIHNDYDDSASDDNDNDNGDSASDDNDNDNDDSAANDLDNQKDMHMHYSDSKQAVEFKDYQKYSDMSYEYTADQNAPEVGENVINIDEDDDKPSRPIDNSIYRSYAMIRPAFYNGVRFYPQNYVPFLSRDNSGAYDPEDSLELGKSYNDEEEQEQSAKFRETNHNNFDADDELAVVS